MAINILVITPFFPYPSKTGGHQAILNGIKALTSFANVHIVYCDKIKDRNSDNIKRILKLNNNIFIHPYIRRLTEFSIYEIFTILFNRIKRLFNKKENIFCLRDFDIKLDASNNYLEYINDLIEKYQIDIVQMEMIGTLPYVISIPNKVKTVFVHHELGYIIRELALDNFNNSLYSRAMVELAKEREISLLNKFDRVITLSCIDAQKLIDNGVNKNKIKSSFAIVDTPTNIDNQILIKKIITMIGPESQRPNAIGIKWFLDNCWYKILEKDPNFEFHIIGSWSKKSIKKIEYSYKNVRFLGFIDNLSKELIGTTLVVPITIGSGIRMKILEAVGRKVPFVSTKVGAEGLPFLSDINCTISDDANDFIKGIFKMQNSQIRRMYVNSAYEIYKQNFTLEALEDSRKAIFEDLIK